MEATIIIGAGISGLTIASGMKNDNFLILEARDRIGGRVFTNDKYMDMDMGAAWIHGSDNNPLNKFLDYEKLIPISENNPWMHSENTNIKYFCSKYNITETDRQRLTEKWNIIAAKIGNIKDKTIVEAFLSLWDNDKDEDYFIFLYMIEVWCGGSVKNLSSSFLNTTNYKEALFGDYGGSHFLFENGTKTLVDSIVNSSNNNYHDKIKYNKIVTHVNYNDDFVEVITNDGCVYLCNKLCITVPPGPLKNIIFNPPLKKDRIDSLSKIKLGSYKKIQLEFSKDNIFWENENVPMFLISNPSLNGRDYYLNKCDDTKEIYPYMLWNNYNYSKQKPILEAVCPANIGWKLSGKSDEEIVEIAMSNLRNYFPNAPDPIS
jgi:monoamine oxidase